MDLIKQIGEGLFGIGLTRLQKRNMAFGSSISAGMFDVALVGFQARNAGRGGVIPAIAGQTIVTAASAPLVGFASAALCTLPWVGPFAAVFLVGALTAYPEYRLGYSLTTSFRTFTDFAKRTRHLEMGGSYQDSELAQRQRFIALQDMNASMIPGRRFLGNEARLMNHL